MRTEHPAGEQAEVRVDEPADAAGRQALVEATGHHADALDGASAENGVGPQLRFDWTCPSCGGRAPAAVAVCPNCGSRAGCC